MQHHVNVRASVANIDNPIVADLEHALQLVEHCDLPVARRNMVDRLNLSGLRVVPETRAEDMIDRHDAFQRGLDDFHGSSRDNVEVESVSLNGLAEDFGQQTDVL